MGKVFNKRLLKDKRKFLRKNQTETEKLLWKHLRKRQLKGYRFTRQFSVNSYILDFYCPKNIVAIELDGGQHNEESNKEYDAKRATLLEIQNIKIIRFWNNEVMENIEGVLDTILLELKKTDSNPS